MPHFHSLMVYTVFKDTSLDTVNMDSAQLNGVKLSDLISGNIESHIPFEETYQIA